MNEWLQRWRQLTLPWRAAWLLALSLPILAAGWLIMLLPQQQARAERDRQLIQQTQLEQQRQQQLALWPAADELIAEISRLQQPLVMDDSPQRLESILAARGTQLDAWQPESQPQQVVLRLSWQQFTPLFAELAHTTMPVPERFQLQSEHGTLMAQLWLEKSDAQ
ncbi:hypothetical protein PUG81_21130 [Erwiniaceae bacterium L1_54_6]|nr:hypothetical protein [Erwiniaceae bacterium L1_54_6]